MTKILLYPLEINPILQISLLSTDILHQQLKKVAKQPVITKMDLSSCVENTSQAVPLPSHLVSSLVQIKVSQKETTAQLTLGKLTTHLSPTLHKQMRCSRSAPLFSHHSKKFKTGCSFVS